MADFLTPTINSNSGGSDVISQLLSLVQGGNTNPQQANAALGQGTLNVLNQTAQQTNNPSMAGGNVDMTQQSPTALTQPQVAQNLQAAAQSNKAGTTNITNQNLTTSQQMAMDSIKKAHQKNLDAIAQNMPLAVSGQLIDSWANNGGTQVPMSTPQGAPQQLQSSMGSNIAVSNPNSPINSSNVPSKNISSQSVNNSNVNSKQPKSIDDQISDINKQTQLLVAKRNQELGKAPTLWQNIIKMYGGVTQADQLDNLEKIQKMAGGEPIQPKDIATMTKEMKVAAIGATKDSITAEASKISSLSDLYGKEEANRNVFDIAQGKESANQSKIRDAMEKAANRFNGHVGNLGTLIDSLPEITSQGIKQKAATVDKQSSDMAAMIAEAKKRAAQGNKTFANIQ